MESVDIGGASDRGRPPIPVMRTVSEDGAPVSDEGAVVYSRLADAEDNTPEDRVPERVARSVDPGTKVAYPSSHPANDTEYDLDAQGGILLGKGQSVASPRIPLGDVRKGYTSGPRKDFSQQPQDDYHQDRVVEQHQQPQRQPQQQPASEPVNSALAELQQEVNKARDNDMSFVRNDAGTPLVEVLFNTDIGAIVSYYRRVEQYEDKIIFISDNRQGDNQRFIPRPAVENGAPKEMEIVITGKDRNSFSRTVVPLGINFTVDGYDFSVMLVKSE